MKIELLKYMTDRYLNEEANVRNPGPVITISREAGCPAKKLADKLTQSLNDKLVVKGKKTEWKWVSKEILFESARELGLDPKNIQYVFDYEQKSLIEELLSSHANKYYKSDRKIRNTIARVIRSIANEGHSVIVGRGGVAITKDIQRSLHINLHAPLDWRLVRISSKHNMSLEDAKEYANDLDKKRQQFRNYFHGKNTDYTWFDVTFNCMALTLDEMAETIVKMVEIRDLLY